MMCLVETILVLWTVDLGARNCEKTTKWHFKRVRKKKSSHILGSIFVPSSLIQDIMTNCKGEWPSLWDKQTARHMICQTLKTKPRLCFAQWSKSIFGDSRLKDRENYISKSNVLQLDFKRHFMSQSMDTMEYVQGAFLFHDGRCFLVLGVNLSIISIITPTTKFVY